MTSEDSHRVIRTVCKWMDAGQCGVLAHVDNGVLTKVEPADFPESGYRHICARGLCTPRLVYHPDRLQYPLKRSGQRGEGKWQRISWDEALDTIVERMTGISNMWGPQAFGWISNTGPLTSACAYERYAAVWGGTWIPTMGPGDAAAPCADIISYGYPSSILEEGGLMANFENPQLCVVWGLNPAETQSFPYRRLINAKERGARIVVIDPRFTPTASKAHQYMAIRPGTDAALALGLINVIIGAGLHDRAFISAHTVGPFLVRADDGRFVRPSDMGLSGREDSYVVWDTLTGTPKVHDQAGVEAALEGSFTVGRTECKPAFQLLADLARQYPVKKVSEITGIAPDDITKLANDYVRAKPVATFRGWGLQRTFHGHLSHRAITTLAAVTGNVSLEGPRQFVLNWKAFLRPDGKAARQLPVMKMYHAVINEDPFPLKALWIGGANMLNQCPNSNKMVNEVLERLEFNVVVDLFLTSTAQYADIVLPGTTFYECTDIALGFTHPYLQLQQKVIEPLHESKSGLEIMSALAARTGLGQYFDKTDEDYLALVLSSEHPSMRGVSFGILKEGPIRSSPYGAPSFATPSGRLDFYSESMQDFGEQLPLYKEPIESPRAELGQTYPLVFLQTHTKFRVHSSFANVDWMRELDPEPLLDMHSSDAEARGIRDGDIVEVFNARGKLHARVKVHQGIKPGVVNIGEGWWPSDFACGHHQNLTHDAVNPAQEFTFQPNAAYYDTLVEVRRVEEG